MARLCTYRFTVQRGASPSFGNAPMIVDADPLDDE